MGQTIAEAWTIVQKSTGSVETLSWVPWSDESARKATSVTLGVAFAKPQTTAP